MSIFSENLKQFRDKQGYSMDELVKRLNANYPLKFTKTTFARWENGETSPSIDHASALAHFFDVSLDEMNKNESITLPHGVNKNIETIAAHIDENLTEAEMNSITNYIKFIQSSRERGV